MGKPQKIITIALWSILLLAMVGVVVGKLVAKPEPALPVLFPAAEFALTDQDGKGFSASDLRGRPYVAGFVFTTCSGICPRMTATMAGLQKELPAEVQLVSFSVDPTHDTPAVLKEYATAAKADPARWHFLTGPRDKAIGVVEAMKFPYKDKEGDSPILHSENLLLIDGNGNVRGIYHTAQAEDMKALVPDAGNLVREQRAGRTPARAAVAEAGGVTP